MTRADLQRRADFRPGFDKRGEEPNGGIDGGSLYWTLIGPLGAVSFEMLTDWYPASVPWHMIASGARGPMMGQISWHRPADRVAPGEDLYRSDLCAYLGVPCRYRVCYSCADPALEALLSGGSEALWGKLEALYQEEFEPVGPFTVAVISAGLRPIVTTADDYAAAEQVLLDACGSPHVRHVRLSNAGGELRSWNWGEVMA